MQERGGAGRMTLKKVFTKPKSIYAILLLGVFTFLFLGAEYMYVNMLSLTAGEEKTVIAQNYALGVSAVGFFLYPLLYRAMKKRGQIAVLTFLAFAATVCIFLIQKHISYLSTMLVGMAFFFWGCWEVQFTACFFIWQQIVITWRAWLASPTHLEFFCSF